MEEQLKPEIAEDPGKFRVRTRSAKGASGQPALSVKGLNSMSPISRPPQPEGWQRPA